MENIKEPIQQLNEIRNLMERSSRFMSLSGLSGVAAGIFAIAGAGGSSEGLIQVHCFFW